jgi:hypothetical protein
MAAALTPPVTSLLRAIQAARETTWVWDIEGRPEAIFGVVPLDDRTASIWMVGTDALETHKRFLLRQVRPGRRQLQRRWPLLVNTADARNTLHHRFIKWAGFTFFAERRLNGLRFLDFARINQMCDPISLSVATFAIGAASAVTSYVGQNQMAEQNRANVISSNNTQYAYMQNRMEHERRAGVQQITENRIRPSVPRAPPRLRQAKPASSACPSTISSGTSMGRQGRFTDSVNQNFEMSAQLSPRSRGERTALRDRAASTRSRKATSFASRLRSRAAGSARQAYFKMKNIDSL